MLSPHRDALITLVDEQLRVPELLADRRVELAVLRRRAVQLVDALLGDVDGTSHGFPRHVAELAEAHADDAAFLTVLLSALARLEKHAWDVLTEPGGGNEPVERVWHLSRAFGEARDALVRVFFAHKQRAESELARLEARFEALLAGQTAHGELREDD